MNDREMYCDREPYDRDSDVILGSLDFNYMKNDKESHYLKRYQRALRVYKQESLYSYLKLSDPSGIKHLAIEQLVKLENSKPIQDILHRERKPNENINMSFGSKNVFKFYSILHKIKKSIRKE